MKLTIPKKNIGIPADGQKVAVVTGGAGVLGGSIAKHLVEQGVNVVVLGRHEQNTMEKVEELKEKIPISLNIKKNEETGSQIEVVLN